MSVRLRPLRPLRSPERVWLESWIGETAASIGSTAGQLLEACADEERSTLAILHEGAPIGVVVCRVGWPAEDAGVIDLVAIPRRHARGGHGMAAASAIERKLRGEGLRVIYAPAPERHGIAVYFWIRLGYRPLLRPQWPAACDGAIWMRRDLPQKKGSQSRIA